MKRNQPVCRRLGAVLLCAFLAAALALPAFGEAPQPVEAPQASSAAVTVQGSVYYGTDYIQFALTGAPDGNQYYCDLTYEDGGTHYVMRRVGCVPGTEIGFDVPGAQYTYTLTVYTLAPAYTVVATGRSVTACAVLGGQDPAKRVPVALCTVGCDAQGVQTQSLTYTAPLTYYDTDAQADYDLAGAEELAVTAGAPCEAAYVPYTDAALTGSVTFVDDAGGILLFESTGGNGTLDKAEVRLSATGADGTGKTTLALDQLDGVTKQADGSYTLTGANGVTYTVAQAGLSSLVFNYYGTIHFVVRCTDPTVSDFYYATIRYVDESGGLLLSDRVYIKQSFTYYAPTAFSMKSGGSIVYYETGLQDAVLQFAPGAPVAERTRTVRYTASDGSKPYVWSIRLINAETGALLDDGTLSAVSLTVGTDNTATNALTYTPAAALAAGGVTYELDGTHMENGAPKTYTHAYGDGARVLYLYYVPEGYTRPASYDVTVQYVNIADRRVLSTTTVTATSAQDAHIDCPADFELDGVTYVRLNGQPDTYDHGYNNPQRVYSIYYRDKNAAQYENTVIITTEVIESERIVETIIDRGINADGTPTAGAAGGQTFTATVNAATGETTLLTPGGTDTADAREQIAENDTPLAAPTPTQPESMNRTGGFWGSAAGIVTIVCLCIVGLCLMALALLLYRHNREKQPTADTERKD